MKEKSSNNKKRWLFIGRCMMFILLVLTTFSLSCLLYKQENDKSQVEDDILMDKIQEDVISVSKTPMEFILVQEPVTAKTSINLRNKPSQGSDSRIMYILEHGELALRVGISDSGWSKVMIENEVYYGVSSLLTTDLEDTALTPTPTFQEDDNVQTKFKEVNHKVTAKEAVNLRTLPSVTREDSEVVVQIKNGDIVIRTGINIDLGWSRVEYEGKILYCVSRYLVTVE